MKKIEGDVKYPFEEKSETKITYSQPDGQVRVLRGILIQDNDPDFFTLQRRDGIKKISKKAVITIESDNK